MMKPSQAPCLRGLRIFPPPLSTTERAHLLDIMTRKKVLLMAAAIIFLGSISVYLARQRHDRVRAMATASGMIAVFSGVAMGLYGLRLKDRQ